MKKIALIISFLSVSSALLAQNTDSLAIRKFFNTALANGEAYNTLNYMCTHIGQRLAGSENAEKAVAYMKAKLKEVGADSVWLQPCMVTHWVRGDKETASAVSPKTKKKLIIPCTALGGSIATGPQGLKAQVVEVHSIDEVAKLGRDKVNGKIVFYNGPFDPTILNTFSAYSAAVVQRTGEPWKEQNTGQWVCLFAR